MGWEYKGQSSPLSYILPAVLPVLGTEPLRAAQLAHAFAAKAFCSLSVLSLGGLQLHWNLSIFIMRIVNDTAKTNTGAREMVQ